MRLLIALLLFALPAQAALTVTAVATFHNVSYYSAHADSSGDVCQVWYKDTSSAEWTRGYDPIWAAAYEGGSAGFRGSVIGLSANTAYDVKVVIVGSDSGEVEVTTWSESPVILRTHNIGDIYSSGALTLNDSDGTDGGWIRILGDGSTVIDADTSDEAAVRVTKCSYLILENLIIRGGKSGIHIGDFYTAEENDCDHIRIINCDISGWGRVPVSQGTDGIWEDSDGNNIYTGSMATIQAGIHIGFSNQVVVERCYIHDSEGKTNTWSGPTWESTHPEGVHCIATAGGNNCVVRYNDLSGSTGHGYDDNMPAYLNNFYWGGLDRDSDIHGNIMAYSNDDNIELDGSALNVRVYQNRFLYSFSSVSTNPTMDGPSYIFRNVFDHQKDPTGTYNLAFKMGGGGAGTAHVFHNTIYVDNVCIGPSSAAGYLAVVRNNILHCFTAAGLAFEPSPTDQDMSIADYDLYYGRVLPLGTTHSETNGTNNRPTYTDSASGDFSLAVGSQGINSGTVLYNFSDGYVSTAPDAGAFEYGASGMVPYRPINITADKYRVTGSEYTTVTLTAGSIDSTWHFTMEMSDSNTFLTITPVTGTIANGGTATLTFSSTSADSSDIAIVKFANGYSIPIAVDAFVGDVPTPAHYYNKRLFIRKY